MTHSPQSTPSTPVSASHASNLCGDARMALLIDKRREKAAELAGVDIEIALALGDRDAAQRARKEMEVQIGARLASRESGCYFDAAGWADQIRRAAA